MAGPLIGLGVGILLGLRFKGFVLVPVTLAAIMILAVGGLNWSKVGWMFLTAVAIEAGYLVGLVATELAAKFPHLDWHQISRWLRNSAFHGKRLLARLASWLMKDAGISPSSLDRRSGYR
jgi:hypothetical protein